MGNGTALTNALLISEHTPLFGFREHGYRFAIVFAITSEAIAIAMLAGFLVQTRSHARGRGAALPDQRAGLPPHGEPINRRPSPGPAES